MSPDTPSRNSSSLNPVSSFCNWDPMCISLEHVPMHHSDLYSSSRIMKKENEEGFASLLKLIALTWEVCHLPSLGVGTRASGREEQADESGHWCWVISCDERSKLCSKVWNWTTDWSVVGAKGGGHCTGRILSISLVNRGRNHVEACPSLSGED